jgi:hypothetical protein
MGFIPGIFMQEPPKRKGPAAASPVFFISGKVWLSLIVVESLYR